MGDNLRWENEMPKVTNKFDQLVEDLVNGDLGLTHIQMAIRTSIRQRKDIPEGVKDLLCGSSAHDSGLIYSMFKPIKEAIGTVELAYRRGSQGDKKSHNQPS